MDIKVIQHQPEELVITHSLIELMTTLLLQYSVIGIPSGGEDPFDGSQLHIEHIDSTQVVFHTIGDFQVSHGGHIR